MDAFATSMRSTGSIDTADLEKKIDDQTPR